MSGVKIAKCVLCQSVPQTTTYVGDTIIHCEGSNSNPDLLKDHECWIRKPTRKEAIDAWNAVMYRGMQR